MKLDRRPITESERAALEWLLEGNGQKFVSPLAPDGPFAVQQANLVATHRGLERKDLVTIGHPNFFGTRSVNITKRGREAVAAAPSVGPAPKDGAG